MASYFGPALALGALGNMGEDFYKEKLAQQKQQPAMEGQIIQNVGAMNALPYQKQKFEAEARMLPLQEQQAQMQLDYQKAQMGDLDAQRRLRSTQEQNLATTMARRQQMQQELLGAGGDVLKTQAILRKYADILPAQAVGDILKPPTQHLWDDPRYWEGREKQLRAQGMNAEANLARVHSYDAYLKARTANQQSTPQTKAAELGMKMAQSYLRAPTGSGLDLSKLTTDPALQQKMYENLVAHFTNLMLKAHGMPPSMPETPLPPALTKQADSWLEMGRGIWNSFWDGMFGPSVQQSGPALEPPPGVTIPLEETRPADDGWGIKEIQ